MKLKKLPIDQIVIDPRVQPRVQLDEAYVAELRENLADLPPVVVFISPDYAPILADGFHRVAAFKAEGRKHIEADVRQGKLGDAQWHSAGANRRHGQRMTRDDKRRAVAMLLVSHPKASNSKIADQVGVSPTTVASVRATIQVGESIREGADGRTIDTSNIGKQKATESTPTPAETPDDDDGPSPVVELSRTTRKPEPIEVVAEVRDQTGKVITDPSIAAYFQRRQEMQDLATAISKVRCAVEKAHEQGDKLFAGINLTALQAACNNAYREITYAMPHAICRYCNGDGREGCKCCKGLGWVGKLAFEQTAQELK